MRTTKITATRTRIRAIGQRTVSRTRKTDLPLGYVLYRGPSAIDGAPIVVILTGYTAARKASRKTRKTGANSKTGAMLQMYILRSDVLPLVAIANGLDSSICGGCVHRGRLDKTTGRYRGRTCYVEVGKGATNVYRTYHRGRYVDATKYGPEQLAGIVTELDVTYGVRFGAYGDPAAIPAVMGIVPTLRSAAAFTTGYTHQWRASFAAHLRGLIMASCDTTEDRTRATSAGWATFTVHAMSADPFAAGEMPCPASKEMGHSVTCSECKGCDGTPGNDYAIIAHGFAGSRYTGRRELPVI
jgi:hypothetical protein